MGGHMKDMYFAGRLEEMGGGVESGSFIAAETGTSRAESGVKQLITYVKSVKTGWTFVSIQPYSVLLNDVHVFGALTALFLAALFVLSVFLSQKIASSIHNPIKAMVEKFADTAPAGPIDEINLLGDIFTKTVSRAKNLEDTLTASLGAAKITYVNYLLKGEVEKVENALPVYENLGIGLFNVYFLTVLSEIADIPAPGTMTSGAESSGSLNGAEDADSLLRAFVMENIATELLSEICKISYVQAGSSRAVILLYLNQPEAPPALDAALNKLSEIMEQYFNSRVISYVSGITDNWRDISGCYDSLVMACGMRLLREKRAVLYCHGRNVRDELLHNFVVKQYPKKLLNRLFENIQAGSPDTLAAVDEIMEFFADMSLYYAQNYCRHIMLSIFSKFDAYIGVSDEKLIELFSGIEKIDECATFESLHRVFSAYVDGCMRSLEWKKKNINNNAVEKVADYVSKHYGDCNISLNGMAAMVGLSSVYLGKIFASVKGVAFTEYLNSIRLERAAELLTNTRMHITAISESVGVASPNYFYTIFRKKYGVTPANYRKAQNGSDPNS
jgi:AraC-like DNA-binding protein